MMVVVEDSGTQLWWGGLHAVRNVARRRSRKWAAAGTAGDRDGAGRRGLSAGDLVPAGCDHGRAEAALLLAALWPSGAPPATHAKGSIDGSSYLWNMAVLPNAVVSADTTTVAFSPDGTFLVTAGAHTPLWATATGTKITTISVTSGVVAFGPQGQMLATAFDNRVAVWAPAHG
jgi:WD40 repeat protein